jgi:hypothetical protein
VKYADAGFGDMLAFAILKGFMLSGRVFLEKYIAAAKAH